ncbi:HNH endonuclease domain-containing protein [Leptospira barantonii]|nr:HNH endonuclease domain-containing protein [Leptospira barantonii]
MSECHIAYWEFMPTYDHVLPIAREGKDSFDNLVTTSMKNNLLKSNSLPEEIGFSLKEKGNLKNWNGLINWYKSYMKDKSIESFDLSMRKWHNALIKYEKINGEI